MPCIRVNFFRALFLSSIIVFPMLAAAKDFQRDNCLPPEEPFPYKLSKSDPLYEAARDEHQAYLEGMEDYINCLDRERSSALSLLEKSFRNFMKNFGKDGVLKYWASTEIED